MSMSADGIYSETLLSIVNAKLDELVEKRNIFETTKSKVLQAATAQENQKERIRVLVEGVKECFQIHTSSNGSMTSNVFANNTNFFSVLKNLQRFLAQPQYDPSVPLALLEEWADVLTQQLDTQSARYKYASLYAEIVTEWLSTRPASGGEGDISGAFEEIDSSAKMSSRLEWEDVVFNPQETDVKAINIFLQQLFQQDEKDSQVFKALKTLREKVDHFESELRQAGQFTSSNLQWVIEGLLAGELLTEGKRTVLRDFVRNPLILNELADVLNLRLANLDNWKWGPVVPVEQRRRITGEFSIHMHEDLLQAIFLQYIGVKWSVFWKDALQNFVKSEGAWKFTGKDVSPQDMKRREHYLGIVHRGPTLQAERKRMWAKYFLAQLLGSEDQKLVHDAGGEEAHFYSFDGPPRTVQAPQNHMARRMERRMSTAATMATNAAYGASAMHYDTASSRAFGGGRLFAQQMPTADDLEQDEVVLFNDKENIQPQDLMSMKQNLLHLLRTEILINSRLYGETTAFRAQFKNWNSMLPHSTILCVMKYLGVSPRWMKFFQAFLQAPLGFMEDGKTEEPRTRRRGVPGSHPLSDLFGEAILFCLDFKVNQETQGSNTFRMSDDIWFWSVDHGIAVKAWLATKDFADLMGLSLDEEHAGAARVVRDKGNPSSIDSQLPPQKITWGFLYLEPLSGQFEINQELVDSHVDELRRQLHGKNHSVLQWVQAWNAYADTFFATNFGQPANSFGRDHIEKVLLMQEKVQKSIFKDNGDADNVGDFLKHMLETRFGVSDIPEGYIYFPTQLGGLDLRNPFVSLLLIHDPTNTMSNPEEYLDKFEADEREGYEAAKRRFEKGSFRNKQKTSLFGEPGGKNAFGFSDEDLNTFFSFEEYVRYREELTYSSTTELFKVFNTLMERPTEQSIECTTSMMPVITDIGNTVSGSDIETSGIKNDWHSMTSYWKWICAMYGPEMLKKVGGLNIVDKGLLPTGMVSLFRGERITWRG